MCVTPMVEKPSRTGAIVFVGLIGSALALLLVVYIAGKKERDVHAVFTDAVLKVARGRDEDGYWIGDVSDLFRMGSISREVAEADIAPRSPLVEQPRPFHGYFLRTMESGPDASENWAPLALKGSTRNKITFAICVFPAGNDWKGKPVYLVCPRGIFKKPSEGNKPILEWPSDIRNLNSGWALVD